MQAMSRLFSESEAADLRLRNLPQPTAKLAFEDLAGVVLFGAGRMSRALIPHLRRRGIQPGWLIDNNPALWGRHLDGVPIRPRESLAEVGDRMVLIMTIYLKPMAEACALAKVRRWSWFTDLHECFGNLSFAIAAERLLAEPEIDRLAGLLDDSEESLQVLRKSLTCRVTGDAADYPACLPDQYFAAELAPADAYARFVDCGAFIGDTLHGWLARYGSTLPIERCGYHAFEPEAQNFRQLQSYVGRLSPTWQERVRLYPSAVGAARGLARMAADGAGSGLHGSESDIEVDVVRLDDALADVDVSAIKMDLEGYEPQALDGARQLIRRQRPILLIAIYHRVEQLWQIPLWIHDLGLGYKLRLRHHDRSCTETVCYAVPEQRAWR